MFERQIRQQIGSRLGRASRRLLYMGILRQGCTYFQHNQSCCHGPLAVRLHSLAVYCLLITLSNTPFNVTEISFLESFELVEIKMLFTLFRQSQYKCKRKFVEHCFFLAFFIVSGENCLCINSMYYFCFSNNQEQLEHLQRFLT